jgi:hypothetical protein
MHRWLSAGELSEKRGLCWARCLHYRGTSKYDYVRYVNIQFQPRLLNKWGIVSVFGGDIGRSSSDYDFRFIPGIICNGYIDNYCPRGSTKCHTG